MSTQNYFIGIDIGGTKCAVTYGTDKMDILSHYQFATHAEKGPYFAIDEIKKCLAILEKSYDFTQLKSIGISCGGPLNSETGIILSPPNLPGWDDIPIVDIIKKATNKPTFIQNDANSCALAEWRFGAGRGYKNVVFLTFGTGLGAGLILDGKLYAGTNDNAGEVGHVRLNSNGPSGFNKSGSFEGYCSGSGIAKIAQIRAEEKLNIGQKLSYCESYDELQGITTLQLSKLANAGDADALEVFEISAKKLGYGLSVIIDILNPEIIIIGSVYARNPQLFSKLSVEIIEKEALKGAWSVCKIVPAELGDKVGDVASLSVAIDGFFKINIEKNIEKNECR